MIGITVENILPSSKVNNGMSRSTASTPANADPLNDQQPIENIYECNYYNYVNTNTLQSSHQSLTASATSPNSPPTGESSSRAAATSKRRRSNNKGNDSGCYGKPEPLGKKYNEFRQRRQHDHKNRAGINIQEHLNFMPSANNVDNDSFNERNPMGVVGGGVASSSVTGDEQAVRTFITTGAGRII